MHASAFVFALLAGLLPSAFALDKSLLTPHGVVPSSSNLHAIPEGGRIEHVGSQVHLIDANGKVLHVAETSKPSPVRASVDPLETGWIAYAWLYNEDSSPISSFLTTYTVPPEPSSDDGQTLFLFNSIEPASGDAILQPVLQYGPSAAGGGSYWAVATWYLVGSQTYFTTPIQVSAGQDLDGVITLTSVSGSSYNYVSSYSNIDGTTLTVTGAEQLVWATETLEVYSVESISDFPSGSTVFSEISLELSDGTNPSGSWTAVSDTTDGITTTINVDSVTDGEITIQY